MLPETHRLVLEKLLHRLNSEEITWALTGSASFALSGLDFVVNEIDLQTDKLGAYQIEICFPNHVIQPVTFSSSDRIRSHSNTAPLFRVTTTTMRGSRLYVS
jgi:hypothetical protein